MSPFPSRTFEMASDYTDRGYEVTVELPNRYHRSDKAYPLVVVLDGQWVFGVVRDAFRIMSLERELPEAVVVWVAHSNPAVGDLLQDRAADFTPTEAESPKETGVRIPAEAVGQAHLFGRTLLDEIVAATTPISISVGSSSKVRLTRRSLVVPRASVYAPYSPDRALVAPHRRW